MKKITATVVSIILLIGSVCSASNNDKKILRLVPKSNGIAKLGYTYNSRSDIKDGVGAFSLHRLDFKGRVPIKIADNFVFAPGVVFDLHYFRFHDVTNYLNQSSLNLYDIGATFDGYLTFGDNWMLDINFTPVISSDLKSLGRKDFQFQTYALAGWAFSDSASFLFGVAVNKSQFWRYLPYPVVGFVVRPVDSFFELEMVLPSYIRADFKVADFCKLFIQGDFEGSVWNIKGDGSVPDHYGKYMDTHAGAGARFKVIRGLELEVWGGVNPYRKVEFLDNSGQTAQRRLDLGYFGAANVIITPEMFARPVKQNESPSSL